jgi:hypothetical protein
LILGTSVIRKFKGRATALRVSHCKIRKKRGILVNPELKDVLLSGQAYRIEDRRDQKRESPAGAGLL